MASFRTEGREEYARLAPGRYAWRVEKADPEYREKDGAEQIKLTLKVGTRAQSVTVFETLTFSENAFYYVERFLKSAGIYPGDGEDVDVYPSELIGKTGWCETCDKESTNGKTYVRIAKWLAASEQSPNALPRSHRRGGMVASADRYDQDSAVAPTGDDIPF